MEDNRFERRMEMDELKVKLSTRFMRNIVTKIIAKTIFKKFGYKVDIQLNKIEVEAIDGKVYLHVDVDAETTNEDFAKIIKSIGLD